MSLHSWCMASQPTSLLIDLMHDWLIVLTGSTLQLFNHNQQTNNWSMTLEPKQTSCLLNEACYTLLVDCLWLGKLDPTSLSGPRSKDQTNQIKPNLAHSQILNIIFHALSINWFEHKIPVTLGSLKYWGKTSLKSIIRFLRAKDNKPTKHKT